MLRACKIAIAAHLKAFEYPLTNVEPVILAKIVIFRLSGLIDWPWLSSLGKKCGHSQSSKNGRPWVDLAQESGKPDSIFACRPVKQMRWKSESVC